jgi:hypothetical protein
LSTERGGKVAALFHATRDMSPAQRREFLDRECAGDESLRDEVLELVELAVDASRDGFLSAKTRDDGLRRPATIAVSGQSRYYKFDLFRGSGVQQTVDLQELLRGRLRTALKIVLVSFSVFFAINLFDGSFARPANRPIFCVHLIVIATAAVSSGLLTGGRALAIRALRTLELANLFTIAAFFTLYQIGQFHVATWEACQVAAPETDVIALVRDSCVLRWITLQVSYGLVFPNTGRRCAIVVVCLALCPEAITAGVGLYEGTLRQLEDCWVEMIVWMAMGSAIAIYGSSRLDQLRNQAIEARKVGPYDIKRKLGSGGMGEVFLAEHARLRRPCAIKLIRPEQAGDVATLRRFEREVQVTATLMHPNTVRIFDYGISEDGTFYCTMEYLPGSSLQELVDEHGCLPPGRAVCLLRQVCLALREAHGLGLVHRDIKPGNIMVSRLGGIADFVKLLDFGLARTVAGQRSRDGGTDGGFIAGTPGYLSPEQAAGRDDLDARSDIYSLGLVGYFLLTGRPAYSGKTPLHLLLAHRDRQVRPPSVPEGEIPADLEQVIARCLKDEPADRFPDVTNLAAALGSCGCAADWTESDADRWWQEHPIEDVPIDFDAIDFRGVR